MSSDVKPYAMMDTADEEQIMRDSDVRQALSYNVGGKKALSYSGVKMIFIEYLQKSGFSSKIVTENTFCNLEKDDPEDKHTWHWRAQASIRIEKPEGETGQLKYFETLGYGERSYLFTDGQCKPADVGKYNPFGKRTASGLAIRNAMRMQMPEAQLLVMLKRLEGTDNMQNLNAQQQQAPPSQPKPAQVTERPQAPPQQQQQAAPPAQPPQQQQQQQLAPASKPEEVLATMVCKQCGTPLKKVMKTSNYQGKITTKPQWQNASTGQPHYYPTTQDAEGKMQFRCNVDTSAPEPQETPAANPHNGQPMPKKWCECMLCKTDFVPNAEDGFCYCQRCSLPVQPQQAAQLLKERGGGSQ